VGAAGSSPATPTTHLVDAEDRTIDQIAGLLDLRAGTVKSLLHRALKELEIAPYLTFWRDGRTQLLYALAPAEVAAQFSLIAAEARAGHDVSDSQPGHAAVTAVVDFSDASCP
jgi:hypothetical protein